MYGRSNVSSGCPEFVSDLLPASDSAFDLGGSQRAWRDVYVARKLLADSIAEKTSDIGVTVDSVLLKDGNVDLSALASYYVKLNGSIIRPHQVFPGDYLDILKSDGSTLQNVRMANLYASAVSASAVNMYLLCYSSNDAHFIFTTWLGGYRNVALMNQDKFWLTDDNFFKVARDSDGVLPTPSAAYRGYMIRSEGAAGVADRMYMCMKKVDDSYQWVQVASG